MGQIACYTLLLLAAFLISTTTAPLTLWEYRIDLLGCLTPAVALMEGPYLGMVFGLLTGVMYDVGQSGVEGFYPIYYMVFGVAAGLFANRFLRRIFPSMLLLTVISVMGVAVLRLFGMFILQQRFDLLLYAQRSCGQALFAVLCSPLVYLPVRAVYHRFHREV